MVHHDPLWPLRREFAAAFLGGCQRIGVEGCEGREGGEEEGESGGEGGGEDAGEGRYRGGGGEIELDAGSIVISTSCSHYSYFFKALDDDHSSCIPSRRALILLYSLGPWYHH